MLEQCGNACEYCGHDTLKNLCVHHNTYASYPLEHSTDLVVLCKECHHTFHKIFKPRSLKHCSGRVLLRWNGTGKIKKCFLCGISHGHGMRSRLSVHKCAKGEPKRAISVCDFCHRVMKVESLHKEKLNKCIIRKRSP